jgi:ribonuclease HII
VADFTWERHCWRDGYLLVAGVDEAGRGALAGPLVAAAVVFKAGTRLSSRLCQIDDSKVLTHNRRTELAVCIRERAAAWGIGIVTADQIDEIGLGPANRLAMELAIAGMAIEPDFVLLDAFTCDCEHPQSGLIDGDAISTSIAAASILAKTERDRIMQDAHLEHELYGFDRHVGYGTPEHLDALRTHGPCVLHRRSFRGVLPEQLAELENDTVRDMVNPEPYA